MQGLPEFVHSIHLVIWFVKQVLELVKHYSLNKLYKFYKKPEAHSTAHV